MVPSDAVGVGEVRGARSGRPAGTVAGGLGGHARFTMVSWGPSPQFFVFNYSKVAHFFAWSP